MGDTPIGNKLRLCIVDALRVVYSGGPEATAESTFNAGAMIVSKDPVAAELVGLSMLNDVRTARGLPAVAESAEELAYLSAAHQKGLGIAVWHGVDLERLTI